MTTKRNTPLWHLGYITDKTLQRKLAVFNVIGGLWANSVLIANQQAIKIDDDGNKRTVRASHPYGNIYSIDGRTFSALMKSGYIERRYTGTAEDQGLLIAEDVDYIMTRKGKRHYRQLTKNLVKFWSCRDMMEQNQRAGGCYFNPREMESFGTRIHEQYGDFVMIKSDKDKYFPIGNREYDVIQVMADGTIRDIATDLATLYKARKVATQYTREGRTVIYCQKYRLQINRYKYGNPAHATHDHGYYKRQITLASWRRLARLVGNGNAVEGMRELKAAMMKGDGNIIIL